MLIKIKFLTLQEAVSIWYNAYSTKYHCCSYESKYPTIKWSHKPSNTTKYSYGTKLQSILRSSITEFLPLLQFSFNCCWNYKQRSIKVCNQCSFLCLQEPIMRYHCNKRSKTFNTARKQYCIIHTRKFTIEHLYYSPIKELPTHWKESHRE